MEIPIKTFEQIEAMQQGGQIAALIKKRLVETACPGITTNELDLLAARLLHQFEARSSFKGYQHYPKNIVTCLNEEVVHAIPSVRVLREGDLLTLDLGVYYQGLHVDTAVTAEVRSEKWEVGNKKSDFLQVGRKALERAIQQCRAGNRVGDISVAIQSTIGTAGCSVIKMFVGHGIGKNLHEPPQIPCWGVPKTGEKLKSGMTLAVEVMYSQGSAEIKILPDGWTAVTKDGSLAALFEETIAVTQDKPLILTV